MHYFQKIFYGISGVLSSYPAIMSDSILMNSFNRYLNNIVGGRKIVKYLSDLNDLGAPATGAGQIIPYLSFKILEDYYDYKDYVPNGRGAQTKRMLTEMKARIEKNKDSI